MTDQSRELTCSQCQANADAAVRLLRDVLEAACRRDGLLLESKADPGKPARNYELADRLGIGYVFVPGKQAIPDD